MIVHTKWENDYNTFSAVLVSYKPYLLRKQKSHHPLRDLQFDWDKKQGLCLHVSVCHDFLLFCHSRFNGLFIRIITLPVRQLHPKQAISFLITATNTQILFDFTKANFSFLLSETCFESKKSGFVLLLLAHRKLCKSTDLRST